ncbi:hypothetical protein [Pseudomonas sessilinigenes]|uniref:Uncharacterized protein n=1 Tax=Pseudomonas sessilinigenes TaxID=658629 RepID=A0ABX8MLE4_9PSED|nr:hypothetical protein [Pseudomonas sessilinigenes]AZC26899.1 hypothetical protein C4K39_5254 [Pseudomonas sessilinigenes]QXH39133.1 hypothetical protein KSS89_23265 [Pseudomonas sessilinigenes]
MSECDDYFAFHLFAARFANDTEAALFAFEQWEAEPGPDATDAQYHAWEARNPSWRLRQELGWSIDSDFVELIPQQGHLEYLESMIRSAAQRQRLHWPVLLQYSHFILVAHAGIAHFGQSLALPSTLSLDYLGEFNGPHP